MSGAREGEARSFLPLTPVAFEILLSLGVGTRHGYAIMQDIEERSGGMINVHPGTLYRAVARLVESGLIEERDGGPAEDVDDARRRYYELTVLGRSVASAEADRLRRGIAAAQGLGLRNEPGPA